MHNRFAKSATLLAIPAAILIGLTGCGGSSNDGQTNGQLSGALAATMATTDLTGTWKLNKDLSDPPPDRQGPDSLRHGRHRPGDQDQRFGRHGHRPPGDSLCPPMSDSLRMHREFSITIAQTDSTVTMTGPFGRNHTLYTDGRAMAPDGPRAPEGATISATWNAQGELVVVHTGPRGGTRTDTFSLITNGTQLVIVSETTRPNGVERSFRRVFDAVSSGG